MIKDFTLITCSFNTPRITETMLKSFAVYHRERIGQKVIIMENSTNDETVAMLHGNRIGYIRTVGGSHPSTLERALLGCDTRYALVVDTDIVFQGSINEELERFAREDITLSGLVCGSRGGWELMDRIHPWFMLVNIENVNKHNIKFCNFDKLRATDSEWFYIPEHACVRNNIDYPGKRYDVGATFYEDINEAGLKTENRTELERLFVHYEGSSWQRTCQTNDAIRQNGNETWERYQLEIEKFKFADIYGFFEGQSYVK